MYYGCVFIYIITTCISYKELKFQRKLWFDLLITLYFSLSSADEFCLSPVYVFISLHIDRTSFANLHSLQLVTGMKSFIMKLLARTYSLESEL